MKSSEIIRIAREDFLDDVADAPDVDDEDLGWSSAFLVRACGEGERQACRRGDNRLIYDEETTALCRITLVADTRSYALDTRILLIDRVLYDGEPLARATEQELDDLYSGWRSQDTGAPVRWYIKGRRLYLDRAPSSVEAGELLTLQVYREPLQAPKEDEAPEIALQHHRSLVHWICYTAYMRRDEETYNAKKAAEHLALFERAFGPAVDARVLEHQLESTGKLAHYTGRDYADWHRRHDSDGWRDEW